MKNSARGDSSRASEPNAIEEACREASRTVEPCELRASVVKEASLSSGARQGVHPTLHAALGVLDVFFAEPLFEINSVDRINRTHEVALVTERNSRVDAHAALEHGV
jgi:hypothetical protein